MQDEINKLVESLKAHKSEYTPSEIEKVLLSEGYNRRVVIAVINQLYFSDRKEENKEKENTKKEPIEKKEIKEEEKKESNILKEKKDTIDKNDFLYEAKSILQELKKQVSSQNKNQVAEKKEITERIEKKPVEIKKIEKKEPDIKKPIEYNVPAVKNTILPIEDNAIKDTSEEIDLSKIPRRLRRFYRKKLMENDNSSSDIRKESFDRHNPIQEKREKDVADIIFEQISKAGIDTKKEKVKAITEKEIKSFKERYHREPSRSEELNTIVDNIFTQVERERKLSKDKKEITEKIEKKEDNKEDIANLDITNITEKDSNKKDKKNINDLDMDLDLNLDLE